MPLSSPWEQLATGARALAHLHRSAGSSDWRRWGIVLATCGNQTRSAQTGWLQSAEILLLLFWGAKTRRWAVSKPCFLPQTCAQAAPSLCPMPWSSLILRAGILWLVTVSLQSLSPLHAPPPLIVLFFMQWHQLSDLGPSRLQYGLMLNNYICRNHIFKKGHIPRFWGGLGC